MRIDANLALALCSTRFRLLGMPVPGVERMDRTETVTFRIDGVNRAILLWDNHGDLGFAYKAGLDWPARDLTSASELAEFMHVFDRMLLDARPDAGPILALCNELARHVDMRTLDDVLLDSKTATMQDMTGALNRLAELEPKVASAVDAYLSGDGPSADGDLTAWHDRIDGWLSEGKTPEPIMIGDCTARRVVTRVGLTTAAYRAGSSIDVVLQGDKPRGFKRLRDLLHRKPVEMLPDRIELYEIRRAGEAGSMLVRMGKDGTPSDVWKPFGCTIPSDAVDDLSPSPHRHSTPRM